MELSKIILSMLVVLLVIVLVIAPWVFLFKNVGNFYSNTWSKSSRALLSNIYDSLDTGDLILFTPHVSNPGITSFLQIKYSHIAMVIRDSGRNTTRDQVIDDPDTFAIDGLYLSETGQALAQGIIAPEYYLKQGVNMTPLLARLKLYPGSIFIMKLIKKLTEPQKNAIILAAKDRFNIPYPSIPQIMVSAVLSRPVPHCFNHVIALMHAAEVDPLFGQMLKQDVITICRSVVDLSKMKKMYRPIVEVLYDIDAITDI